MTLNADPAVVPPYVILIDDDSAIHALVAAMLRSSGVRLDVASDGEQGLALACHRQIKPFAVKTRRAKQIDSLVYLVSFVKFFISY